MTLYVLVLLRMQRYIEPLTLETRQIANIPITDYQWNVEAGGELLGGLLC